MKLPFRSTKPFSRLSNTDAARPTGFLPSLKAEYNKLLGLVDGIEQRVQRPLPPGEPAVAIGRQVFAPNRNSTVEYFLYDTAGLSSQAYPVLMSGQTYEVPVTFPPPGLFRAHSIKVNLRRRINVSASGGGTPGPLVGVAEVPMCLGNMSMANPGTTNNTGATSTTKTSGAFFQENMNAINFMWNIVDTKSGNQLSDQFLPDTLLQFQPSRPPLLPRFFSKLQSMPLPVDSSYSVAYSNLSSDGSYFTLDAPWLFERDAQVRFLFRPITDVVQPLSAGGLAVYTIPYGLLTATASVFGQDNFDTSVTVQVELHGTRHYDEQDALRIGALSRDD